MKLPWSFPHGGVLLVGVFCALSYGRAIATEPGSHGRIEAGSAGGVAAGPTSKIDVADSSAGKRREERGKPAADSKAQDEDGDREVMERRKKMFILMLQILRAPK